MHPADWHAERGFCEQQGIKLSEELMTEEELIEFQSKSLKAERSGTSFNSVDKFECQTFDSEDRPEFDESGMSIDYD